MITNIGTVSWKKKSFQVLKLGSNFSNNSIIVGGQIQHMCNLHMKCKGYENIGSCVHKLVQSLINFAETLLCSWVREKKRDKLSIEGAQNVLSFFEGSGF